MSHARFPLAAVFLALAPALALAAADPKPAATATPPAEAAVATTPPPRGAVLEEVAGTVRAVDRKAHRVELDTASGPVTLSLDRNTLVFGQGGLVTVNELAVGAPIRAGRNADLLAYWIQLRNGAGHAPSSTPAQGSGPGGGAGPAGAGTGEGTVRGSGAAGAPAPPGPGTGGSPGGTRGP